MSHSAGNACAPISKQTRPSDARGPKPAPARDTEPKKPRERTLEPQKPDGHRARARARPKTALRSAGHHRRQPHQRRSTMSLRRSQWEMGRTSGPLDRRAKA